MNSQFLIICGHNLVMQITEETESVKSAAHVPYEDEGLLVHVVQCFANVMEEREVCNHD